MAIEHAEESQRLTNYYAQMYDGELQQLAENPSDLTDIARQVLETELKKRGLDRESQSKAQRNSTFASDPGPADVAENDSQEGEEVEFTWKTDLCTCNDWAQGQLLRETLHRAGIQSWTDPPYAQSYGRDFKILVAADQLDEALKILEQPLPQNILDDSKTEVPEFELPTCPHCGAPDPILEMTGEATEEAVGEAIGDEPVEEAGQEAAEPANSWVCEACGARWRDSMEPSGAGGTE